MPKMTSWIRLVTVVMGAAALFACGKSNGNAPMLDSSGKHPAGWLEQHWVAYRQTTPVAADGAASVSPCAECHGSDLKGGISKVSCFSAAAQNGQACHALGPVTGSHGWQTAVAHGSSGAMAAPGISSGFAYCTKCHGSNYDNGNAVSCKFCHTAAPHPPKPWFSPDGSGSSHTLANEQNAAECAKCHTNGANFGPQIGTPAPAGTAPGCFNNTLCHGSDNISHAVGWSNPTSANFHGITAKAAPDLISACGTCHRSNLLGAGIIPSCMSATAIDGIKCHATSPAANPGCASCHGNQSSAAPNGTTAPNRNFSHGKHVALTGVTCNTCHNGHGSVTATHAKGTTDISLTSTFTAKTAAAPVFNADGTCSGVSCHGGQTTPAWSGGSIVLATDCLKCHVQGTAAATPQFNSFFSGNFANGTLNVLHSFHLGVNKHNTTTKIFCTDCHNTTTLAVSHFAGLDTPGFTAPADTIGGGTTSIISYDKIGKTCSTAACHFLADPHDWIP